MLGLMLDPSKRCAVPVSCLARILGKISHLLKVPIHNAHWYPYIHISTMIMEMVYTQCTNLVSVRDVKFEHTGTPMGPISGPAGLLHSLNTSG